MFKGPFLSNNLLKFNGYFLFLRHTKKVQSKFYLCTLKKRHKLLLLSRKMVKWDIKIRLIY